jgi:uncharacterized repeat protein (TIGR03803 family)
MYRVPLFSAVFPSRRTTKAGAEASMFEIRHCLTKGLVAGALAVAALLHTPTAKAAATESVVYSFCSQGGCADGTDPEASLTNVGGTLYGTTYLGGTGCSGACGTVFSLNPTTGDETVLHAFHRTASNRGKDGTNPAAGLIKVGARLYGTTVRGGSSSCSGNGCGTVFSINPTTGGETVLHAFHNNGTDGQYPEAGLIDVGGTLYGTTSEGGTASCTGSQGCGTVFALDPTTGTETFVHSFQGPDGWRPYAGLIDVGGLLYGTTVEGGTGACSNGCGTLFSVNPATGAETVLYSFLGKSKDGRGPRGGLINVNGTLYGTTQEGGSTGCGGLGCGTVFSFNTTTSTETVLHTFPNSGTGGTYPSAGVISVNGTLYGTTVEGGTGACSGGCGTVFSLNPTSGMLRVLHSFQNDGTDGINPFAGLIDVRGTLYGTTEGGGAHEGGIVFAITHWQ